MGEIFKPGQSEKEKIQKIANELQISEEKAKEILNKRDFDKTTTKKDLEKFL